MKKENLLPLNLQFFAENPDPENKDNPTPQDNPTPKDDPEPEKKDPEPEKKDPEPEKKEPTTQELMLEMAKLKRAVDKASSEAAEYKKKWRESLSETEKASREKAEAEAKKEEEFESMKKQLKVNEYTENFMALGYSKDLAKQAATAQVDGDTETLFKIQSDV